jgi:acyl dehydratase
MQISSTFVGTTLKEYVADISWRRTMNYAAGTGDANPRYLDDERKDGIVAPPMFAVAATWPVSERIWEYIEAEDFPREILVTQVHYTEHLRIHRTLRPGESLRIRGSIAAIVPHRSGTLVVIRYDAADANGSLVFTEHMGGLMRGVKCTDDGKGAEDIPESVKLDHKPDPIRSVKIPVDPLAPFVYDGCTNIFFPIHTSVAFARSVGLPGIILQGTASLAYCVREIVNRELQGDPSAVASIACRFTGMVRPGTDITLNLFTEQTTEAETSYFFELLNAEGAAAVSDGHVKLRPAL